MTLSLTPTTPGSLYLSAPYPLSAMSVYNVKDYGATGDGVTNDTDRVIEAITSAHSVVNGITIQGILFWPAGRYIVDSTLVPIGFSGSDIHWVGAGETQTYVTLADGANVALLDTSTFPNKVTIENMAFGCWDAAGQATHTANAFPMLKLTSSYLSRLNNVLVQFAPGDGVQIGNGVTSPPADGITFNECQILSSLGHGIYNDRSEAMKVFGGAIESNTLYNIYVKGNPDTTYMQGSVYGARFEEQSGAGGIFLDRVTGYDIRGNYFNAGNGVTLNELSHGNTVQGNQFLSGATLHDGGYMNVTAPNDGIFDPTTKPKHFFFPASRISDGDGTSTLTSFWTGLNRSGGTGSLSKSSPNGLNVGIGSEEIAGRGAPLKIIPNSTNGYTAYQDMTVAPAETYLVEVYWASEFRSPSGATFQVQLTNVGGATVYWDSGALTHPHAPTSNQWRLGRTSFVFQVPAAVTTVRVALSATYSSAVHVDRVNFVKLLNNNGGMEGTYASGVAANWAVNATSGSPTKAQETAIVRPNLPGAAIPTGTATPSSQKLAVANGTDYIEIFSTPTIDSSRLYLVRGYVYVSSGDPKHAYLAWGDSGTPTFFYKWKASPTKTGQWDPVSRVFRPGTSNLLCAGLSAGSAITAYFDDISVVPLRELLTEKTAVSQEFTLSAAAASQAVVVPSVDSVLRRILVTYTVATDGNAGVALNVGTYATAAYYGTATSAISTAQGTCAEIALAKTDIVAGRPIVVACAGGKVGTGKVQIALEYE